MLSFPNAKINLGLNILSKRADAYHDIETVFYPVAWCDALEIIPSENFEFTQTGLQLDTAESDNLCVKAYHLLKNQFKIGNVQMHLHKVIPSGAGLGGGSSDAAFTLKILSQIFELDLNNDLLKKYSSKLGSDCAFFIDNQASFGKGKGDELERIDINLNDKYFVVVKPRVHVSTAEAYAGVKPQKPELSVKQILKLDIKEWKLLLKNDFEESVFLKHPVIKNLKEQFYQMGALYASMSGSGAAVYGIFENEVDITVFNDLDCWAGKAIS